MPREIKIAFVELPAIVIRQTVSGASTVWKNLINVSMMGFSRAKRRKGVTLKSFSHKRRENMAKILLVDDEQYIRELYSEELSAEGHNVSTLGTGHNLLKRIELSQPEVVILDIRLVDYDGLELLQEIRKKHHDLPVILCTAYDTYKYDPKTIAADYYIVKSFDLSQLKMAIQKALEADISLGRTTWSLV